MTVTGHLIELRPANPEDLPRIVELFAGANDAPYDLAAVAEEKCFGAGLGGVPQPLLATLTDDEFAGMVVTCGQSVRILAVVRKRRRQQIGSILLREAEKQIAAAGKTDSHAGTEAGNYFLPGVPAGDEGLQRFFHLHGYERLPEEPVDLRVRLARNPLLDAPGGNRVRRARPEDREKILSFIETRFAPAWRLEAARAFEHDEPTLFVSEEQGQIAGFSAHDANNRGLGFFGPAGVIEKMRGRGIGRALLLASLRDLRDRGFSATIIAWSAAHEFYREVSGAEVAQRYLRLRKRLQP